MNPVFTRQDFVVARKNEGRQNARTADSLLHKHLASGDIVHLRRGLFAHAATEPDPFLVAAKLAPDATIAYHAALQFHGNAYSVWHRYLVLTRADLRPFSLDGNDFIGVAPPRPLARLKDLGGLIRDEPHAGHTVRVTTLERTLVDVLDRPHLGGGWEEIWRSLESVDFFDLDEVVAYALKLKTAATVARVGYFLDQHREQLFVEDKHLAPLKKRAPRQAIYLDAKNRKGGTLVKPWNLIVPERVLQRAWEEPDVVA